MKKSLVLTLTLVFMLAIASTAFAAQANPFADVPQKHWAYEAVEKLSKAGIVDGYDSKTYGGEKTMTRYEMAQVVGKAMYRSDKADAENKKLIDKLATEFAAELNNLGVRLTTLEKNQPNLKLTGQVDVRYTDKPAENPAKTAANGQYRLRLNGDAKVDANTNFGVRLVSKLTKKGNTFKWNSSTFTTFGDTQTNDNNVSIDRLYIATNLGAVKTTIGEQALAFGANNFVFDSSAYNFAGVRFAGKAGDVNLALNWGRFESNLDVASLEAGAKSGKLNYGLGYLTLKDNKTGDAYFNKTIAKYIDVNAKYQFDNKFSFGAEHVINQATDAAYNEKGKATYVFALYGAQSLTKQNDQNLRLVYYKANANGLTQWTSVDCLNTNSADAYVGNKDFKAFVATYSYAFSKAFSGYLTYAKVNDDQATAKSNGGFKYYRAGLTAKF